MSNSAKLSKRAKKRKYILNHLKARYALAGMIGARGAVVTCDQYREEDCKTQIMSLFDEYAEEWYPSEQKEQASGLSVDQILEQELQKLKAPEKEDMRFSFLDTGCKGVLFVRFHESTLSPTEFITRIMKETLETGKKMTKNIARVVPAEMSCYAKLEDIEKMVQPFIAKQFEALQPCAYAISYKSRVNEGIHREEVIKLVASFVPPEFKVNLSQPDVTILVEIVKTVATVSIVRDYQKYSRFNLQEIGVEKEAKGPTPSKSKKVSCVEDGEEKTDAGEPCSKKAKLDGDEEAAEPSKLEVTATKTSDE